MWQCIVPYSLLSGEFSSDIYIYIYDCSVVFIDGIDGFSKLGTKHKPVPTMWALIINVHIFAIHMIYSYMIFCSINQFQEPIFEYV